MELLPQGAIYRTFQDFFGISGLQERNRAFLEMCTILFRTSPLQGERKAPRWCASVVITSSGFLAYKKVIEISGTINVYSTFQNLSAAVVVTFSGFLDYKKGM